MTILVGAVTVANNSNLVPWSTVTYTTNTIVTNVTFSTANTNAYMTNISLAAGVLTITRNA